MRTTAQMRLLVAEIAIAGLQQTPLSPEDRADFYEGLSALLPAPPSEAARYAATCIRESQRAQRDFLAALHPGKAAASP